MNRLLTPVICLLLLAACAEEREPGPRAVDLAAGKAIAENNCSGCHSLDGRGKTAEIPNLAAQPAEYLTASMQAYRDGQRRHAALQEMIAGFSEADVRNIAAWFSSLPPLPPESLVQQSDAMYLEGAAAAAVCARCHGEHGFSTTPGIPSLAGQQPAYLMISTQEYASGSRGHVEKEEMLAGLDDVDIEKMAIYFASQAPTRREPPSFGDPVAGEPLTAVCGSCHGARGISQDPMIPNLAGQEPTYLVNAIKAYRGGERSHEEMVADKSDSEIESIAAFYSVQAAGSVIEQDEQIEETVAKCQRCHGAAAGQSSMVVPTLDGQKQEYLLRVMKQYRDGERGSSMMHKMSSGYSDQLLNDLAAWYATQ